MKKIIKLTSLTLLLIILLSAIGLSIVLTTVSPNKFKPLLTAQTLKYTGRELTIEGNLSWTFFPNLGVKAEHLVLNNPPPFKEKVFAQIEQVKMGVKLLPLFHAKVQTTGIVVSGLTLNLIKTANGQNNWQDLQQKSSSTAATIPPQSVERINYRSADQPVTTISNGGKRVAISLDIPSVDINNASITLDDQQAKQQVQIENFKLHAENISFDKAFPITNSWNFRTTNPASSGQVALSGLVRLDLEKQIYLIDNIQLAIKTEKAAKKIAINIQGDIVADLTQQTLKFSHFVSQVANLTLNGKVNISDLTTRPRFTGHLQAQPFDLKAWLAAMGQDNKNLQVAKDVSAEFDFSSAVPTTSASSLSPFASLQAINMQGNIRIKQLQAAKLKINDVNIQTRLQQGILEFIPITAALYQGNMQGNAKVDFTSVIPKISLRANLTNVQAESLLQDIGNADSKIKVKGVGDVEMAVTTSGLTGDGMLLNLNGTSRLNFRNGLIEGIDIGYWVDSAYSLVGKQVAVGQNTQHTDFGTLTASAVIHNGVVSNKDLKLDSPRFDTSGLGIINLPGQKIDYELKTISKQAAQNQPKNILNVYNLIIPIRIAGDLSDPKISLDTANILKQVTRQQVERFADKLQGKLPDEIKAQLPVDAGKLIQGLLGQ